MHLGLPSWSVDFRWSGGLSGGWRDNEDRTMSPGAVRRANALAEGDGAPASAWDDGLPEEGRFSEAELIEKARGAPRRDLAPV